MELTELRRHWERFGSTDPFWAVLTAPGREGGGWDPAEFFDSGRVEVARVMSRVRATVDPRNLATDRALDFGCGVGRATQALCGQFRRCDGVDISAAMVAEADRHNVHGDRCAYHVNTESDLRRFGDATFDFVYTAHVLQHMEPRYARRYVTEFFRVLRPGGVAVFEITTDRAPGATQPLPDTAFRARVDILHAPRRLRAGECVDVAVRVTNESDATWPATGTGGWFHVTVGNHWRGVSGRFVRVDDGRAALPRDLAPGDAVQVAVPVTAPRRPGWYRLAVDPVQEGVSWFADKGSAPAAVSVAVRPAFGRGRVPSGQNAPVMEMYGTPEPEVRGWVRAAGGEMLATFDWDEISRQRSIDWRRVGFVALRPA